MHILFVCHFLPHARARDSGRQDYYHYIKSLSTHHNVSVIAFVPPEDEAGVVEMNTFCDEVAAVPYQHTGILTRLQQIFWRLMRPHIYGGNQSQLYRRNLKTLVAEHRFDVAVVHGVMALYGRYLANIPSVLDEMDLFFMVAHQLFRNTTNPLFRLWLGFDWLRTSFWEAHYLSDFQGVFVRSSKDKVVARELVPQQRIAILPPWFEGLEELQSVPIERPSGNDILFVGAMNLSPNIEAVVYFANKVLPRVQTIIPGVQFQIIGANPTKVVQQLSQQPGVKVVGEVSSLTPYYANAAVVVVPLLTGGGIIVKTLNGLSSGRPVAATKIGISGIEAIANRHLCIVPIEPAAMAQEIASILVDNEKWERLAENGRHFIQTNFDWLQIMGNMSDFLQKIAKQEYVD